MSIGGSIVLQFASTLTLNFPRTLFFSRHPYSSYPSYPPPGCFLSGGEAQRLNIARALVSKPDLLLLDDPTNNLQDDLANEVMSNIRKLPCTVIFTTQDPDLIKHSDVCGLLQDRGISELMRTDNLRAGTFKERERDVHPSYLASSIYPSYTPFIHLPYHIYTMYTRYTSIYTPYIHHIYA